MVFSHGLGGSKNAYSQILGNLASYGMVVIAPDHRDGSAPISFIESFDGLDRKAVEYISIPHRKGQDVEDGRNAQLRIRLWELGLIHEALLRIDHGNLFRHRIAQQEKTSLQGTELATFTDSLDVHTPGRVSWSGHSFGAATMVQFLKSVYYSGAPVPSSYHALYSPSRPSSINSQITAMSPLCLFDLWALPLRSVATEWLWQQPLPCYASSGKGGSNLLAILSEAFYKWRANLSMTKNIIFPQINGRPSVATGLEPPHVFYAIASTHMGQSDFGVLFPWLTRRVSKSTDPIRDLRLNIRATLELMRRNGLDIADTSFLDADIISKNQCTSSPLNEKRQNRKGQKSEILATDNSIESWMAVAANDIMDQKTGEATNTNLGENATPAEAIIEGEILDNEKPAGKL